MYMYMHVCSHFSFPLLRAFNYKFLKCLLSYNDISQQCVTLYISCCHLNDIRRAVRRYTRLCAVIDCFSA